MVKKLILYVPGLIITQVGNHIIDSKMSLKITYLIFLKILNFSLRDNIILVV